MKMERVESSNIKAIGYDDGSKTLRVEFHSGASHDYPDTSPEQHADFMAADSKGKHFHKHFRKKI